MPKRKRTPPPPGDGGQSPTPKDSQPDSNADADAKPFEPRYLLAWCCRLAFMGQPIPPAAIDKLTPSERERVVALAGLANKSLRSDAVRSWPHSQEWIAAMKNVDATKTPDIHEFTDIGNGHRLADACLSKLRYVPALGAWISWDGKRWARDSGHPERTCAQQVAEAMRKDPSLPKKFVDYCQSKAAIEKMIWMAKDKMILDINRLDSDPWSINCENGIVDLRDGSLRPHDPNEFHSRMCPVAYDPNAKCPNFLQFLRLIHHGEDVDEVVGYLQRLLGYYLTGLIHEHKCGFWFGPRGRNGKGGILEIACEVLGDYAAPLNQEIILVQQGHPTHPTSLMVLNGARLAYCDELEDGKKLNEAIIKRLAGGADVVARGMRQDEVRFKPTAKILLLFNHPPVISGTDGGIWGRVEMLMFRVHFTENPDEVNPPHVHLKDKDFYKRELEPELPGIFAWMVRGAVLWAKHGLAPCDRVKRDTALYRRNSDRVGLFLEDRCRLHPDLETKSSDLYEAYGKWCKANGLTAMSNVRLAAEWESRGLTKSRRSDGIYWSGIEVKPDHYSRDGKAF